MLIVRLSEQLLLDMFTVGSSLGACYVREGLPPGCRLQSATVMDWYLRLVFDDSACEDPTPVASLVDAKITYVKYSIDETIPDNIEARRRYQEAIADGLIPEDYGGPPLAALVWLKEYEEGVINSDEYKARYVKSTK